MYFSQIRKHDVANGIGIRTTLFVSGCTLKCKGCFNKEYQNFKNGKKFNFDIENKIIEYLKDECVSGLSILGGEPLDQDETLWHFLNKVKNIVRKPVWLWTGYTYETLNSSQKKLVYEFVDILVDGMFIEELKDLRLRFKGSSNQRVIDIKKTKESGEIILWNS